jgi:3-ketoacyl-CoA synthase
MLACFEGVKGVRLSKSIMDIAGQALKHNITTLGPLVLPISEHIRFFWNYFLRKTSLYRNLNPYVPDFHKAFQHFCIHTGGRAVIDALEKVLKLSEVGIPFLT